MKNILRILRFSESPTWGLILLSFVGILSGLMGFFFIFLINKVTKLFIHGGIDMYDVQYFAAFGGCIFMFFLTRRYLAVKIVNISQNVFWNIRKSIVQLLSKSNYYETQGLKDQIYAAIHHDANSLLQASTILIGVFSSFILVVTCLIYMAVFSLTLFAFSFATLIGGVVVYEMVMKRSNAYFAKSRDLEAGFLKNFDAIFFGLKEINISPSKGSAIFEKNVLPILKEGSKNNKAAYTGYVNSQMVGLIAFYVLIAVTLLHLGFYFEMETSVIINYTFLLLFVLGPVENVMTSIPVLNKAYVSLKKMIQVIDELGERIREEENNTGATALKEFSSIHVSDLVYNYNNQEAFHLGPVNFTVKPAETVFIYGGNGSGKSTFIKVLLQLFRQDEGAVVLDGQKVDDTNRAAYKSLFAVVFSDFYLFDEVYGLDNIVESQVEEYLEIFEVDKKITLKDGKFSTIQLSTGQRKRLAIIAALLENKPILVLDEWAADQDPAFRKKFYKEIIPYLNRKGITIVAITHDDAYYSACDRIYKMDYGKITEEKIKSFPFVERRNPIMESVEVEEKIAS